METISYLAMLKLSEKNKLHAGCFFLIDCEKWGDTIKSYYCTHMHDYKLKCVLPSSMAWYSNIYNDSGTDNNGKSWRQC